MTDPALAVLFAVFIWWFSTGVVLLLNRMSRGAVALSQVLSTLLAVAALLALFHTASQTSVSGAYCAFTSALLVWGWHELSFLTGWVTGPRKTALPPGLSEGRRFVEAVRVILWHEIGIIAVGAFIVFITWGAPNQVGSGTFIVLWVMRTSAKLNLFLGVRNLSEQFLPAHLAYLESCFRRRTLNLLFPFSVSLSTAVLAALIVQALEPATPVATAVGVALVGTMLALAILEHWLLVLPLDSTALWRWAMRKANRRMSAAVPKLDTAVLAPRASADAITCAITSATAAAPAAPAALSTGLR
jgi:putative photosynthetic complex assembly protein 2